MPLVTDMCKKHPEHGGRHGSNIYVDNCMWYMWGQNDKNWIEFSLYFKQISPALAILAIKGWEAV